MTKARSLIKFPTFFQRLISALLVVLFASDAGSQTTDFANEQQIFVAPVPSAQNSTSEVAPSGDVDEIVLSICTRSQAEINGLAELCQTLMARVVTSYADKTVALNEAAVRSEAQTAAFAATTQAHTLDALKDQSLRGDFLFWLAMVMIVLGVFAAILQFVKAWRQDNVAAMEVSVSEKQISIKTTWIGVVLLAMSMGFLGLYLVFVYQITAV